ncbi:MAG: uroporphyrinogen decarboxylase family protein [Nitrospinales bacterium]
MNSRERVFNMLGGKVVDRLPLMPITMQFACKLIGKKYKEYITDHRVLVEGQIRVAEQFGFDYVSCISDPTREASDLGGAVIMEEDSAPGMDYANALLADKSTLLDLQIPDPLKEGSRMLDRVRAAELLKKEVGSEKIIEGWVEGPCAEAADLRSMNSLMMDFYEDPKFVHDLFAFTCELGWQFAKAQIDAGADLIGVGDAMCSLIGPQLYKEFVWPYEKKLIDKIHAYGGAVRLHICGNITDLLEDIAKLKCAFIDVDYPVSMFDARQKLGPKQVIAGNINPVAVLRDSSAEEVYKAVEQCHKQAGSNFIVAAGCEITADTAFENVLALKEYALSHATNPLEFDSGKNKKTFRIVEVAGKKADSMSKKLSSKN